MKAAIRRSARAIATAGLLAVAIASVTGCGAIGAAANPKVAWALNDPAPMSVVVRRVDVAEKTAEHVHRVMTDTPVSDDSAWLAKVAPPKEEATRMLTSLREHPLYAPGTPGQAARIVPAEVWAKSLAQVEPNGADAKATAPMPSEPPPPSAKAARVPSAAASGVKRIDSTDADSAANASDAAETKSATKKSRPGVVARSDRAEKKTAKKAPALATAVEVPAPAPIAAPSPKYPSLLAAIDKDLGVAWTSIVETKKAMGELKARIAAEEAAANQKGVAPADKAAHEKTIEALEKDIAKLEKESDKKTEDFLPKARTAAKKAPAEARERFGGVLVNLRQAVLDATNANGAAALRYPLASPTLLDSAKQMASVFVADVIEEKTGKRPTTKGLQPSVTLDGGKVALTLNGLSQDDVGKLSVADVTSEVASRTSAWVTHALGLLGTISATKDLLTFEDDVLGALIDGFKSSGWSPPAPTIIPDANAATTGERTGKLKRLSVNEAPLRASAP